jgi:hypothetical protein
MGRFSSSPFRASTATGKGSTEMAQGCGTQQSSANRQVDSILTYHNQPLPARVALPRWLADLNSCKTISIVRIRPPFENSVKKKKAPKRESELGAQNRRVGA